MTVLVKDCLGDSCGEALGCCLDGILEVRCNICHIGREIVGLGEGKGSSLESMLKIDFRDNGQVGDVVADHPGFSRNDEVISSNCTRPMDDWSSTAIHCSLFLFGHLV